MSYQPRRAVRAANRLLPKLWDAHLLPPPDLDPATIERQAVRAARLDDFGDPWFREPFALLTASMREEARLNAMGRMIGHGSLIKLLVDRLRAVDLLKRHPEIGRRHLSAPLIIVGPMRSGTTRLQRLLACDQSFVHTRLFEMLCPVPWRASFTARIDPRIGYARRGLAMLHWMNPAIAAIHPTAPMEPDEELGLLELSLCGAQIEVQRHVPTFARWGEANSQLPAYRFMASLLQLTGWFRKDDPARPWLLKTPQYMQDMAALLDVFPDARFLFTHRDPVQVVGSAASLAWHQMVVQSDSVDARWVGGEWLHKTRLRIDRTLAARACIAPARQFDVAFADMDRAPIETMHRIYAWLGRDLDAALEQRMREYLARARREHVHVPHRYALEDFGLSAGAIRDRFADYADRFELLRA